jgi:hypothetical protein
MQDKERLKQLQDYKNNLIIKQKLDNKEITVYDLDEEQLDGVTILYRNEIKELESDIIDIVKDIQTLEHENKVLREQLRRGEYYE